MISMYNNQVERFVDRCFVRHAKHITFKKYGASKNHEKIGVVCHSDRKCSWKLEFNQSSLLISSSFFSDQILYKSIKSCEAVRVSEQDGLISCTKIYDVEYARTLTDREIYKHKKTQNGVVFNYDNRQEYILLCTDSIEKTTEIINSLCDFISRVTKTRAWEDNISH